MGFERVSSAAFVDPPMGGSTGDPASGAVRLERWTVSGCLEDQPDRGQERLAPWTTGLMSLSE